MAKRVYFVRHGESVSNVEGLVQGLHDPLSLEGERQALRIAERARNLSFGTLFSSDATRAHMTADAISAETGIQVTLSPLFREVKRPTTMVGTSHKSDTYLAFLRQEYDMRNDAEWRYEDEERFYDLMPRARDALALLAAHDAEEIMVVSHGHFLRFVLAYMVMGEHLTPDAWHTAFATHFLVTNTGITIAEYTDVSWEPSAKMWRILSWNDHAHFAE